MAFETIHKPAIGEFSVAPNLTDYDGTRSAFQWSDLDDVFEGLPNGGLNLAHEAIDRQANGPNADKVAMYWEGKNGEQESYTFADMKRETNKVAQMLVDLGIQKGDRVFLFMNREPELYIALFGVLKAGAVAGPLFSAFMQEAIKDRLGDSAAVALFTSPDLVERLDAIKGDLPALKTIIINNRDNRFPDYQLKDGEVSYQELTKDKSGEFDIVHTTKDDYSIMHYTSGTTGKPKGAAHVHGAVYGHYWTAKICLDLQADDLYWCTADPGWVTGTSYGMFGPWTNGITQLIWEGGFGADIWYGLIQKYKVTMWYSAPTAIRMLMKESDELPKKYDLSSVRFACSVGEPLNPEAVVWGEKVLGILFHDNWWQTETGCIQIANYNFQDVKPGSMGRPIPGTQAGIIDDEWNEITEANTEGNLALRQGLCPSMFRTYWNKEEMYESRFRNGWYLTGDRAYRDEEGYYWFIGRSDDVINTAGHLVGPFEVESALVEHEAVAEAAVIGKPDPERMEIIKAFISLKDGYTESPDLLEDIRLHVRNKLAAHAYPREIQVLDGLPKTRSGKIMRRLLKARELGLPEGDTSTLED